MQNVTIGRYSAQVAESFAGYIEGTRENGTRWIIYLDEHGTPCTYYPQRSADGGVIGEAIILE